MPFSLRSRGLDCFYCGSRSAFKREPQVREWKCEHCDAVNHLDKSGQITEPLPLSSENATPPAPRFAHAPLRSKSPPITAKDSLFCDTCLKNQYLFTQTLASYLPAPSDPDYSEYERSYPAYRAKLEQRYPQVCSTCLPGVRERIKKAGYVAKTDHLRRMVEQTRLRGVQKQQGLGWRGFILKVGGLGWAVSLTAQILWHLMGVMVQAYHERLKDDFTGFGFGFSYIGNCFQQAFWNQQIQPECVRYTTQWTNTALFLGIATIWWNNALRLRYAGSGGRLTGLKDYYFLQILTIGVRAAACWAIPSDILHGLSLPAYRGAHAFMLLFLLMTTVISLNIVRIDPTPRVSFHSDNEQAMLPDVPETNALTKASPPRRGPPDQFTPARPFPIGSLAQPTGSFPRQVTAYQPPTPPPEDDVLSDVSEMDWTPSTNRYIDFQPRCPAPSAVAQSAQVTEPSPFHGTLPKAPIPPAYKLRNPIHSLSPFRKASQTQQQTFFAGMTRHSGKPGRVGGTSVTDDELDDSDAEDQDCEMQIASPKLFLKQDRLETGLEAMFDEFFSIRDEPNGLEIQGRRSSTGKWQFKRSDEKLTDGNQGTESTGRGWINVFSAVMVPASILAGVAMFVKGWS